MVFLLPLRAHHRQCSEAPPPLRRDKETVLLLLRMSNGELRICFPGRRRTITLPLRLRPGKPRERPRRRVMAVAEGVVVGVARLVRHVPRSRISVQAVRSMDSSSCVRAVCASSVRHRIKVGPSEEGMKEEDRRVAMGAVVERPARLGAMMEGDPRTRQAVSIPMGAIRRGPPL